MDDRYIDNRVKEELEGIEANPPVESWLAISEGLSGRRRKPWYIAGIPAAASVAGIVAAIATWFLVFQDQGEVFESYGTGQALSGITSPVAFSSPLATLDVAMPHRQIPPVAQRGEGMGFSRQTPPVSLTPGPPGPVSVRLPGMAADQGTRVHNVTLMGPDREGAGTRHRNVRFGTHFSPQSNYRLLREGTQWFGMQNIPFEDLEDRIVTIGLGVTAVLELPGNWSLQTGISYLNTGQYVRDIVAYAHPTHKPLYSVHRSSGRVLHPQTIITSQGRVQFSDPHYYFADTQAQRVRTSEHTMAGTGVHTLKRSAEGITQMFRYVELPVVFRYRVVHRGIGLHLKAGVAGNYLLQNDVFLGNNVLSTSIGSTYGVRSFNFSALGGLALDIPLTHRISFHLEPTAQIFLSPVARQEFMAGEAFPYSYSLRTGLSYGF